MSPEYPHRIAGPAEKPDSLGETRNPELDQSRTPPGQRDRRFSFTNVMPFLHKDGRNAKNTLRPQINSTKPYVIREYSREAAIIVLTTRVSKQAPFIRRNVSLTGAAAEQWFQDRYWQASPKTSLRLASDEMGSEAIHITQIWSTAGTFKFTRPDDQKILLLLIGLDGEVSIESGSRFTHLSSGKMCFLRPEPSVGLSSDIPFARIEIILKSDSIPFFRTSLSDPTAAAPLPAGYMEIAAGTVNTVLGSSIAPSDIGFELILQAIENISMAALLQSSHAKERSSSSAISRIISQARVILESQANTPGFSPAELAKQLNISVPYLYRAFASIDTTPAEEIRRLRVSAANRILRHINATSRAELSEIARVVGFPSASAMKRAMQSAALAEDHP